MNPGSPVPEHLLLTSMCYLIHSLCGFSKPLSYPPQPANCQDTFNCLIVSIHRCCLCFLLNGPESIMFSCGLTLNTASSTFGTGANLHFVSRILPNTAQNFVVASMAAASRNDKLKAEPMTSLLPLGIRRIRDTCSP